MSEYEFSSDENKRIDRFNRSMIYFSILLVLAGIATIIEAVLNNPVSYINIVSGVAWLILGIVFYLPTDNLKKIVTTEGQDIKELINAFTELRKGWNIVVIILIIKHILYLIDLI